MTVRDELILGVISLPQAGMAERAQVTGKAGFTGISLWWAELMTRREAGEDLAVVRRELEEAGINAPQMEIITLPPPGGGETFAEHARDVARTARMLGCEVVCSVGRDRAFKPVDYAQSLASLADCCADEGLACVVEFVPKLTAVETAADALALVRATGRRNAGITVDSLHFHRSGCRWGDFDGLRGEEVLAIQLNDGPAAPETDDYHAECMGMRRLVGEGAFELERLLGVLANAGVACPLTIEVASKDLAALPASEAAERLARSGRDALALWRKVSAPGYGPPVSGAENG